jgi:DNA modification methylase
MRPVSELRPNARNARTHSPEQVALIAKSIARFGFTNPLLTDGAEGVVAGHGRLEAALQLGLDKVPTIELSHLSERDRRAYMLADNQLALRAGWDDALLRLEAKELSDLGEGLGDLGFLDEDVADLLGSRQVGLTDPDEAPAAPAEPVTRPGDLWLLGRHRILCGDSTSAADVARVMGEAKPRLMVTDPPYGVEYDASWRQKAGIGSAGAAVGAVLNDDRADWREAWALFPGAVAYVWHGGLHAATVAASLDAVRLRTRAQIVWVKQRGAIGRGAYHWQHEPAWYAVREGEDDAWQRFEPDHEVAAYAVKDGATAQWRGGRKQTTVWFIEHVKSETGHSTQKPIECMRRPIVNNSAPGEHVYEPFSGSGTKIMACEITGRACIAVELNAPYVDVAVERWQAYCGEEATLEGDGRSFAEVRKERLAGATR